MAVGSVGGTYGLSGSGMDIDSIVKKLMTGQQAKADALLQKKTVLQWQKAAYNTVYDDINNFNSTVFNFKLQSTLSPNKVSSANTSVVTATANASASDVNHSLVVAQLAGGANLTSTQAISGHAALGTLATQLGMPTTAFNITIANGTAPSKTLNIDPSKDTLNDVVSKFNSAGVNVQASYDSTLDRFFISTTNTGESSGISFAGSDQAGLNFLGGKLQLSGGITETLPAGSGVYTSAPVQGQDAVFKIDGVSLSEASNTFSISGVTYNLTGVSTGAAMLSPGVMDTTVGQATSVSVTNDVDSAVTSMQSLVDSYNKILDEVNGKLKETRNKDFPPLTDAQRAAMKESEITAWDAKSKSGMLHNDPTLTSLVNTMRNAFSNAVSGITGAYNSASSIGITTGDYTEGGKLYLNKDKMRTALIANPNVLNQLFGATGTNQGISGRLYDGIKKTMAQLKQISGTTGTAQTDVNSNVAQQIIAYNKQISKGTTTFNTIQSAYYKQYNAMEVALQQLNSQSSWITSQLSGSSSSG